MIDVSEQKSIEELIEVNLFLWNNAVISLDEPKKVEYGLKVKELAARYKEVTGKYYFRSVSGERK